MMFETNKYERDEKTKALLSKDVAGLRQRKKELENQRRIDNLEKTVEGMNEKMDLILKLLQNVN